jgi:hypothetical protein
LLESVNKVKKGLKVQQFSGTGKGKQEIEGLTIAECLQKQYQLQRELLAKEQIANNELGNANKSHRTEKRKILDAIVSSKQKCEQTIYHLGVSSRQCTRTGLEEDDDDDDDEDEDGERNLEGGGDDNNFNMGF